MESFEEPQQLNSTRIIQNSIALVIFLIYSQADLARKLHIARTSVLAWENQTSIPTMKHIITMAKLFRITADYLLEVEEKRILSLDG